MDDFNDDLDLGPAPRYPGLDHPLFVWGDQEEDLQLAALGWYLQWRITNPFFLGKDDCHFSRPVPESEVWTAMKPRIMDWAWAEKGGLNLPETHQTLIKRHHLRLKESA